MIHFQAKRQARGKSLSGAVGMSRNVAQSVTFPSKMRLKSFRWKILLDNLNIINGLAEVIGGTSL